MELFTILFLTISSYLFGCGTVLIASKTLSKKRNDEIDDLLMMYEYEGDGDLTTIY